MLNQKAWAELPWVEGGNAFRTIRPGATLLLSAILLASLIGLFAAPSIIERSLFRPFWLVSRREYSTLITSGFVHADLGHLFFNAFTFGFFAFFLNYKIHLLSLLFCL